MSKPVKEMIIEDYRRKFGDVSGALVIDIRGIEANQNNEFRHDLRKKDIAVTVIRNSLARKAFADTPLEGLGPVLEGPSALAFGGESVVDTARALVEWARKIDELDLTPTTSPLISAHQQGTARMATSPRDGAVDPEGRLWNTNEVYVFDSSIFPSSASSHTMAPIMTMSRLLSSALVARLG